MKNLLFVVSIVVSSILSSQCFAQAEGCGHLQNARFRAGNYTAPNPFALFGAQADRNGNQLTLSGNLAFKAQQTNKNCSVVDAQLEIGGSEIIASCENTSQYYTKVSSSSCDQAGNCSVHFIIKQDIDWSLDPIVGGGVAKVKTGSNG